MKVGYTHVRELAASELESIPDEERDREFGSGARRRQFLSGRLLLRKMLQRWTGEPAGSHRVTATAGGKPVCDGGPAISISHTGVWVACGIAESGEIGIDLETVSERRDTEKVADKFFSPEEAEWLATQPKECFYQLWVLKEAYVKAIGQSIFGSVNRMRCTLRPPAINVIDGSGPFRDLCLFAAGNTYLGLVTTQDSMRDLALERWEPGANEPGTNIEFQLTASCYDYAN